MGESKNLCPVKQAVQSGKAELCRRADDGKAPTKDGQGPLRSKEEDENPEQVRSSNCAGAPQKKLPGRAVRSRREPGHELDYTEAGWGCRGDHPRCRREDKMKH